MTNACCETCGGRWLPRCPGESPGPCPWCEIRRLQAVETAARHLRTQERKGQSLGCNWLCRNIRDLFVALEAAEAAKEKKNET